MQYLKSFTLPTDADELEYLLPSKPGKLTKLDMQCYASNQYPFGIFPHKRLSKLEFEPITIFYGGNGSGKSTILNVIAEKLKLERTAPFNNSPIIEDYLKLCEYRLCAGTPYLPDGSSIITSDGVFDYLLDIRAINEGIDRRRDGLLEEYDSIRGELTNCGMYGSVVCSLEGCSFRDAWKELHENTAQLRYQPACAMCPNQRLCHICVAMIYNECGDREGRPEYMCKMNQEASRLYKEFAERHYPELTGRHLPPPPPQDSCEL
jgi:hypothetical protein